MDNETANQNLGRVRSAEEKRAAALVPSNGSRSGGSEGEAERRQALLAAIRGRTGGKTITTTDGSEQQMKIALALSTPRRPRMVFAIDATASRQHAWDMARSVTDSLFSAVPGSLDVALAAHSGGRMTLFSDFHADVHALRDDAASVTCKPGHTRLLDIINRSRDFVGVKMIVYIGDNFEEDESAGMAAVDALRVRGTRLVVLHDETSAHPSARSTFEILTAHTGGCVLPFDINARQSLREMLASLATYAARGRDFLIQRRLTSPSARLLLEHMPG